MSSICNSTLLRGKGLKERVFGLVYFSRSLPFNTATPDRLTKAAISSVQSTWHRANKRKRAEVVVVNAPTEWHWLARTFSVVLLAESPSSWIILHAYCSAAAPRGLQSPHATPTVGVVIVSAIVDMAAVQVLSCHHGHSKGVTWWSSAAVTAAKRTVHVQWGLFSSYGESGTAGPQCHWPWSEHRHVPESVTPEARHDCTLEQLRQGRGHLSVQA